MDHHCGIGGATAIIHIAEVVGTFREGGKVDDAVSQVEAGGAIVPSIDSAARGCGQFDGSADADDALVSLKGSGTTTINCHSCHSRGVRAIDIAYLIGDCDSVRAPH